MERKNKRIFFSIIVIIIIIFAIVAYQYFLPKEEDEKKMLTALDHFEDALALALEWNSEAYPIRVSSVELKGSAEVIMGMEGWHYDLSSDTTYGDGKTPVWLYGFGVDINPYTNESDLAHAFAFYYDGSVKSRDTYYVGDEHQWMEPAIDSDEAAEIAKADQNYSEALKNASDLCISYDYYSYKNEWMDYYQNEWSIRYESPDAEYEGEVRINSDNGTIIP
ncbi:MAG: hypothetical protein JSW00_16105 [Thermoplasmata archaeon]|nr:MAG: hypothetical protein JSW00_16105 [Thermoplasmata archaeon]